MAMLNNQRVQTSVQHMRNELQADGMRKSPFGGNPYADPPIHLPGDVRASIF